MMNFQGNRFRRREREYERERFLSFVIWLIDFVVCVDMTAKWWGPQKVWIFPTQRQRNLTCTGFYVVSVLERNEKDRERRCVVGVDRSHRTHEHHQRSSPKPIKIDVIYLALKWVAGAHCLQVLVLSQTPSNQMSMKTWPNAACEPMVCPYVTRRCAWRGIFRHPNRRAPLRRRFKRFRTVY